MAWTPMDGSEVRSASHAKGLAGYHSNRDRPLIKAPEQICCILLGCHHLGLDDAACLMHQICANGCLVMNATPCRRCPRRAFHPAQRESP